MTTLFATHNPLGLNDSCDHRSTATTVAKVQERCLMNNVLDLNS